MVNVRANKLEIRNVERNPKVLNVESERIRDGHLNEVSAVGDVYFNPFLAVNGLNEI